MNFLYLDEKKLDRHIYRIMKQEHVYSLFADRQNVLTQPHGWKDKFENFQLSIGGKLGGEEFDYAFKHDFVGQCWTQHSLSEAMWGIYASDPEQRYLRIRSTPRKLLSGLIDEHSDMPQDTCFIGAVEYKTEKDLKSFAKNSGHLDVSPTRLARSLLLKRRAFKHEKEVRLIYFGEANQCDDNGLYRYRINPHEMITQIMADPNRDRNYWAADHTAIKERTGFLSEIKRSKMYDPPDWDAPAYVR
jgi:hypothetical protein